MELWQQQEEKPEDCEKLAGRLSPHTIESEIKRSAVEDSLLFALITHLKINRQNFLTTIDKDSL
jgi:hypothetical protein